MANCGSAGTKLFYSEDSGSASSDWTQVKGASSISLSGGSITEIDVTTLDSQGKYMEFCPDVIDPGTLSFTINLSSDNDDEIADLITLKGDFINVKVEWTGGQVWTGYGYVNPESFDVSVGSPTTFSFDVRLSGETTFTASP